MNSNTQELYHIFRQQAYNEREFIEKEIPKVRLQEKHIRNCRLLLNRNELLQHLRKWATVAEIGVDQGVFSRSILEITEPESLHLIDIWQSERYNDGLYHSVCQQFAKEIDSDQIKIHRKLSLQAILDFPNHYFDWIYLDTDHSYSTTIQELYAYEIKMKPNGIIAGHDYSMGNWVSSYPYGVIEAVHHFCVEHNWELLFLTVDQTERQSFAIRKIQQD